MSLAPFQGVAFKLSGGAVVPAPSASIEVRTKDTGALASIFSDEAGATPITNPSAFADANGNFVFYAAGRARGYTVQVTDGAFSYTLHVSVGTAGQLDASTFGNTLINLADLAALRDLLKAPRMLFSYDGGGVANTGATDEEDGIEYEMPADTLSPGDMLLIKAWGHNANTGNTKAARLYFGSQSFGFFIPTNDNGWFSIEFWVVSHGTGPQSVYAKYLVSNNSAVGSDNLSASTEQDEGAPITIKTTSEGGDPGDITWDGLSVQYWPAPAA